MSHEPRPPDLHQEVHALRQELAELRAVQSMHQEARDGLEAIEQQLAGIIHSAMDAIIIIDDDQRIVIFNAAAEEIFQCSAPEALGNTLDQFIPLHLRSAHREHIRRFAETGETSRRMGANMEISGLRRNGETFPLEASISQTERSGKRWLTVILRDISQRKQNEERLSYLGRILEDSVNEIYVFDATTLRFTQVNKGARENIGYTMEELCVMTPLDLKPDLPNDQFLELLALLRTGQREQVDFRTTHRRKDRTTYPVEVHLQYLREEGRRVFLAIIMDLTERVATEQELQEAQRTLSTLLTNLPGMVYRCQNDPGWTMEFISPSCQDLTGFSPEQFVQTRQISYGEHVMLQEDRQRAWQIVQEALNDRKPFQLSYRIRTADGTVKWMWEQGCGIFSETGEIVGIEGYVVDITQQRALEDQLRKTERLAELGTLASGMAHEIGTPMNVILGRAELLMRKAPDERTRRGLETIVTQVERITKIMNQLLSFARKRPAVRQAVNLETVMIDVLDVLQEKLGKQHIQVMKTVSPHLPKVLADPDHMNQVLLNLILNACQAMGDGGTLSLALHPTDDMVELTVQDTGSGIAQEQLAKIFDPFFSTKAVGEGTGLGLTVVHGILEEHQGAIRVTSVPGQGTTFIVSLPMYSEEVRGEA
ncbi:PAS domain-containing sensor histidine kinase [Candidatus Nitrospira neomarina]|uniref:histidine kinase n=1 Tax=Candidatus Nitrospira neomarina TaxID=3020899 RepID=A0AA96JW67_9BACT|nr:PAS domain S-box protein [Candidatus Nitrospira neomarina]WNM62158.1 PAS domain S-box protein [Candidatus Nitrospira neomarina]